MRNLIHKRYMYLVKHLVLDLYNIACQDITELEILRIPSQKIILLK